MRLFEPDLLTVCWECGDPLGHEDVVAASVPGYWSHTPCDLEAACEADAPLERPIVVVEPIHLRSARHGSSRHEAEATERPPPG